jgi:ankyrin repeat protein
MEIPLELIDLICSHVSPEILERISVGNILYLLNEKRIEKYWKKTGILKLIKRGNFKAVKYLYECKDYIDDLAVKYENYLYKSIKIPSKLYEKIYVSCIYGHLDILQYFLGFYKIEETPKRNRKMLYNTMLSKACEYGKLNIVIYLHTILGASIHTNYDDPIVYASGGGHLDVVRYLVENGVSVHVHDESPISNAVKNDHLETVKYLISQGANIHAVKFQALSSMYIKSMEMLKYILSFDPYIIYHNKNSLLLASEKGDLEMVKYIVSMLVDNPIKPKIKNIKDIPDISSCIKIASINGHINIVEYFVENEIDTKKCISLARTNGKIQMVNYLQKIHENRSRGQPNKPSRKKKNN